MSLGTSHRRNATSIPLAEQLFRYSAGDSLAAATYSRTTAGTYADAAGLIQAAVSGVARDSQYVGGARETLLEAARTNILTSRALNAAPWTASNMTVLAFSTADTPVFGQSSYRIYATGVVSHNVNLANTGTSATVYTISVFAKADGEAGMQLAGTNAGFGAEVYANFVLSGSGSVGTTGTAVSNVKIEVFPNSWYRCSFTATSTSTSVGMAVYTNNANSSSARAPAYTGGGSGFGVLLCGPQLEAGDHASAYIYRADGATATAVRNADLLSFPYSYAPMDSTMYFRGRYYGRTNVDNRIITLGLSDGDTGTDAWLLTASSTAPPTVRFTTRSNAGTYLSVTPATDDLTGKGFEACASLSPGATMTVESSVNGGTVNSASGAVSALTFGYGGTLFVSSRAAGGGHVSIGVRDLVIVKGIRDLAWFRNRIP